jgi:hypothetical protein
LEDSHLLGDLAGGSKRLHEHGFVVGNRRRHRVDVDNGHYRVLSECPVGSENADRLSLWVLRAFVVIAAPAAVCNAVDLGHHPLTFCHVARLLGCCIDVELIDPRHKLMSQRMAQRAALVPAGELDVGGADAALDDFDARLTHLWLGNRYRLDHHHSALLQPRREHLKKP